MDYLCGYDIIVKEELPGWRGKISYKEELYILFSRVSPDLPELKNKDYKVLRNGKNFTLYGSNTHTIEQTSLKKFMKNISLNSLLVF